jgi:ABC-2 type transport system permease protein
MTLWRLEVARLVRSRRLVALLGVYAFFGLTGPLLARYMAEIMERVGGGIQVIIPDPVPADGITQFLGNASQIGLLVVLVVAAGALALDATPPLSAFLRTRASIPRLLLPRYVVATGAACAAFTVGMLAAWYETQVLLGSLPVGSMLVGIGLSWLYLAFAVAVVAAVAGFTRGQATTVLGALGALLLLPVVGIAEPVQPWLPSALLGAVTALLEGVPATEYLRALAVTVIATGALIALAARRVERREL